METSGSPDAGGAQTGSGPPTTPTSTSGPPPGPAGVPGPSGSTVPPPGPATTPPTGPSEPGPGSGLTGGDWPAQATSAVVDLVGTVRDKTTGPVTTIARGAVFGLFAAIVGLIVAVLSIIALVRLLDEALPSSVWLPYLILGMVSVLVGAIVFIKRKAPTP